MKEIIKLENLEKFYLHGSTKTSVLTNFSLTLTRGCFTILAGPSGSGKSSLLNIMATLDAPHSGNYFLEDELINFKKKKKLTEIRRDNFGFVFQSFNLIPVLNAVENVELPLTLFKFSPEERRQMAITALSLVGLEEKINSRPSQLSGGEQQRVAIARAIARKPKIIFADEPTANLDKKNAVNIVQLMQKLNINTGISFIIASHDDKVISAGKNVVSIGE